MKTLVVVVHPNLNESRVNRRWVLELENRAEVTIHRLYEAYPDESIDLAAEQALLEQHDRVVLQFPFYWYSSPSLLKKWLDTVLTFNWAYGPEGDKLRGKELVIAVSTGSAQTAYTPAGNNRYEMHELLKPFQATSNLIGMQFVEPFVLYGVKTLTDAELEESAVRYAAYVTNPARLPKLA